MPGGVLTYGLQQAGQGEAHQWCEVSAGLEEGPRIHMLLLEVGRRGSCWRGAVPGDTDLCRVDRVRLTPADRRAEHSTVNGTVAGPDRQSDGCSEPRTERFADGCAESRSNRAD